MYQSPQPIEADFDWKGLLSRGDVVMFRFPIAEAGDCAKAKKPKRRPCLVLEVFEQIGKTFAEVAYGTSVNTNANRGHEVLVKQAGSCSAAGLDKPTRFVGARTVIVSLDHPGFDPKGDEGPIIGHLDGPLTERMNSVRARLHANADMQAEALQERREQEGRRRREERGFLGRNRAFREATPLKLKGGL